MVEYGPGDVFQINEVHGRPGWIGAFVLAEKIKPWGIQGFVCSVKSHDEQQRAYIHLTWDHVDYVGHAPLVPNDVSLVTDSAAKSSAEPT